MNPVYQALLLALLAAVGALGSLVVARWLDRTSYHDVDGTIVVLHLAGLGLLIFAMPTALLLAALRYWFP